LDIPEPPEHIRKFFRRQLLEGNDDDLLAANRAQQEFSNLRRYVLAIERLIDEQERTEVEELKTDAKQLSEEKKGEFWAWRYPVHWDEVVRTLFRESTLMTMTSFLETTLNQICRDVRLVTEEALRQSELQGNAIERSKRYLIRFGRFSESENELWRQVSDIAEIRNAFVHANGKINACRNPKKTRAAMIRSSGLREEEELASIIIKKDYLCNALESIEKFLTYLSSEMRHLCIRRKQFELAERST